MGVAFWGPGGRKRGGGGAAGSEADKFLELYKRVGQVGFMIIITNYYMVFQLIVGQVPTKRA